MALNPLRTMSPACAHHGRDQEETALSMKARPTIYNGIQMRSRLEARVAAWFDSIGVSWAYEPVAFASKGGQYLPDFEIFTPHAPEQLRRRVFVEVKGNLQSIHDLFDLEKRMEAIIGPSDPRAFLVLAEASSLERGYVSTYQYPRLLEWGESVAIPFLVDIGAIAMPDGWRLPPWNAS